MLSVNGVGKPCAGEPHARFDGRELETGWISRHGHGEERLYGKPFGHQGSMSYRRSTPPRQFPTLPLSGSESALVVAGSNTVLVPAPPA